MNLKEEDARLCTGVIRCNVGFCEHGYKHSGSVNAGNFFDTRATIRFSKRTQLLGVMFSYQSTFYCSTMMHTIIKSQEY
jgi:hypothetical protein